MKLLTTLCSEASDFSALARESFRPRRAGRAVILDGGRVALLKVTAHGYYMLPGGGVDSEENLIDGLTREIAEEVGCAVEIMEAVGSAVVYFDRWRQKQTDYCYRTRKLDAPVRATAFTEFERSVGFEVVWARSVEAAIRLTEQAVPEDPEGTLVRLRDLTFLRCARDLARGSSQD